MDPRRARTRTALIEAGARLLAEGREGATIQQITDEAAVGFGSFFNHFGSKEELFRAAVMSCLETYGQVRDAAVEGIDDPAETFAVSFRMTGRFQRDFPEIVRVMLNEGAAILLTSEGLAPRAQRDIESAVRAGRFDVEDPELALMAAGGALLGLLQLLEAKPEADAGQLTDQMTVRVLRAFGMSREEALGLCSRPLPGDVAQAG